MATQVTNFQCPACTGPMHFAEGSGRLECDYCGSSYTVAEVEALYAEKEQSAAQAFDKEEEKREEQAKEREENAAWDSSGMSSEWGSDADGLRVYNCPSCGAELICDETTAATSCPYCGNNTIVPGQLSGALKPDYVIPFKITKEQAIAALRAHYKGKKLLPKLFTDENHIQEIKGVYVPFWMFDGDVDADVTFDATISSTMTTNKERITTINHYDVRRAGVVTFSKIPADASTKMPDEYMDALEPYDYHELKPFSTAYLPGFLADKYDVSVEECSERADRRAVNSAIDAMYDSAASYISKTVKDETSQLHRGDVHYALLPVWMLNTKWKDKTYMFAVNGQTGKTIGDLPVDKGRYWKYFLGIAAGLTVLITVLTGLIGMG